MPELKKSIEQTYGRRFDLTSLREILSVAPDFYAYTWQKVSGYSEPQVVIEMQGDLTQVSERN